MNTTSAYRGLYRYRKHWSYALNKTAPADAYSAFEKLSQQGVASVNEVPWRKII